MYPSNHVFLAKESLLKLIVIYVQYLLHSQNTHRCEMLNMWVVTNTSLHISSFIHFLDSPAPINSFLLQQENGSLRHFISRVSARQHFLHPILNTANSHLSSRTHFCPVWQWLQSGPVWQERPSVKISPRRSIHQPPWRGARFQEALPFPGCPATYLDGWMTTWRRFSAESQWAWSGQSR